MVSAVIRPIFFCGLCIGLLFLKGSAALKDITIAGMFNVFGADGRPDDRQLEHLGAFILAIDEINSNVSFLPGYRINSMIRGGMGFMNTAKNTETIEATDDVAGVINALPNAESKVALTSLGEAGIFAISSLAFDVELGYADLYPYKAQTCPLGSFAGMVLQDYLCHNNQTRVVTFASDDDLGVKFNMELYENSYCEITNLGHFSVATWDTDFAISIEKAFHSAATIFVILLSSPKQTAMLLEQGYNAGLFRLGTQVYITDLTTSTYFSDQADVSSIMHGTIAFKFAPEYFVKTTDPGRAFETNWKAQLDVINACDSVVDVTGFHYLGTSSSPSGCANLNYTAYKKSVKTMGPAVALTYDATYALAYALRGVLMKQLTINASTIRSEVLESVAFTGASGHVDFYPGAPERGGYGLGSREEGFVFVLYNFHDDDYVKGVHNGFAEIGFWDMETDEITCPPALNVKCEPADYNTYNNKPVSAFPPFAHDAPPAVIKIGGLFSAFTEQGTLDIAQVEHMYAFLMALREINDKTDGIADDLLPNSQIVFASMNYIPENLAAVHAVDYVVHSFFESGVVATVNALPSVTSLATDMITSVEKVFQVLVDSTDSKFGNGEDHPYKAQTGVLDTFNGMVLQQIMCDYYHIAKVVTISSGTDYGVKAAIEFGDQTYCDLTVLAALTFASGTTDFSEVIREAKDTGALIYVLFMEPSEAAMVIWQGHLAGLFVKGTQIVISNYSELASFFPKEASANQIATALNGAIAIEFFPDYTLYTRPQGLAFVDRWAEQIDLSGKPCPLTLDDNAVEAVYRTDAHPSLCATLNITKYKHGEAKLSPKTALTYDAVYLLAHGFQRLIDANLAFNGPNLRQVIFDHVNFTGASGYIDIFEGMVDRGGYGQGSREVGVFFKMLNFNRNHFLAQAALGESQSVIDSDAQDNASNSKLSTTSAKATSFLPFGVWDVDSDALLPCVSFETCYTPVYNTKSGMFPPDAPSTIVLKMSPGVQQFLYALAAIIFLLTAFVLVVVVYNRKHAEVRRAQEILLYYILAGILLGGGRVLIAGLDISTTQCIAGLWFGHLSFGFAFGALFLKSWRVNMLLNTSTIKRVVITNTNVTVKMTLAILTLIGYLFAMTYIGKPHLDIKSSTSKNQLTEELFCSLEIPEMHMALFLAEAVILAYGSALCWAIRNVPDKFNESLNNAAGELLSIHRPMCRCVCTYIHLHYIYMYMYAAQCSMLTLI
jgi:ABC-type branched-subunit amino acid transport system substrate-binding protein